MFKHELGKQVKSLCTGMRGIPTARSESLFGMDRYEITPRAKNDKVKDTYVFDEADITYMGKGIKSIEPDDFKHELGLQAKSIISGTEGILIIRTQCLYGCNRYAIQPKPGADGKAADLKGCAEDELRITGDGVTKELRGKEEEKAKEEEKIKAKAKPAKRVGGPIERVPAAGPIR